VITQGHGYFLAIGPFLLTTVEMTDRRAEKEKVGITIFST
jgi:hypothetical protein